MDGYCYREDNITNEELYYKKGKINGKSKIHFYKNSFKSVQINSIATASIANKPIHPIHEYFLIHPDIKVAAVAIKAIDKTRPKTRSP